MSETLIAVCVALLIEYGPLIFWCAVFGLILVIVGAARTR